MFLELKFEIKSEYFNENDDNWPETTLERFWHLNLSDSSGAVYFDNAQTLTSTSQLFMKYRLSFVLCDYLVMLMTLILAIKLWQQSFLNKVVGIISFLKRFQNFIDSISTWFLDTVSDWGGFFYKAFWNLNFMVTWYTSSEK